MNDLCESVTTSVTTTNPLDHGGPFFRILSMWCGQLQYHPGHGQPKGRAPASGHHLTLQCSDAAMSLGVRVKGLVLACMPQDTSDVRWSKMVPC